MKYFRETEDYLLWILILHYNVVKMRSLTNERTYLQFIRDTDTFKYMYAYTSIMYVYVRYELYTRNLVKPTLNTLL